jgi:hypothetical protein
MNGDQIKAVKIRTEFRNCKVIRLFLSNFAPPGPMQRLQLFIWEGCVRNILLFH